MVLLTSGTTGTPKGAPRHQGRSLAPAGAVDDAEFGKRLAAFVVLRPGTALTEEQVRDFVKDNLAR